MNKWLEILLGLILAIGAIVGAYYTIGTSWNFWTAAKTVLLGGAFWAIVGAGMLFILLGISDLKG